MTEWKGACFSAEKLYGMYTHKRPCRIQVENGTIILYSYWLRKPLFSCTLDNILQVQEVKTLGNFYSLMSTTGQKGRESRAVSMNKRNRESFRQWCRETFPERFVSL